MTVTELSSNLEQVPSQTSFTNLLYLLRDKGINVSTAEWLNLQAVLGRGGIQTMEQMYQTSKAMLVKDPSQYPDFAQAFAQFFELSSNNSDSEEQNADPSSANDTGMTADDLALRNLLLQNEDQEKKVQTAVLATPSTASPADVPEDDNQVEETETYGQQTEKPEQANDSTSPSLLSKIREESESRKQAHEQESRRKMYERVLRRLKNKLTSTTAEITDKLDVKGTVKHIAQSGGNIVPIWERAVNIQPQLLLLLDVWGSTDIYVDEMADFWKAASKMLGKITILAYHNAPYGEVWPVEDGNRPIHPIPLSKLWPQAANTKLVIMTDATMPLDRDDNTGLYNRHDINFDHPRLAGAKPKEYRNTGLENFQLMGQHYKRAVIINPNRQRDWTHGYAGTTTNHSLEKIRRIFPMFELTEKGLNNAIDTLLK